jgi:hypothetical protein
VHPRVGLFAGMAFGAFALTSPFVLLDLPHAARDIVYEYRHVMIGAAAQYESTRAGLVAPPPAAPFSQPLFYWAWWLRQNGWPLTLLLIPGAIILNRRRPAAFWTVAVIVAAVAFTLTRAGNKAERYATLLIPLLAIAAGAGLWWVRQRAMDMEHGPLLRAMISVTLLAAFAWPAVDSARLVYREFWLPDTRVLALRWLEAHAEPGALVVREDKTTDVENAPTPYRVISVLSLFAEHSLDDWRQQGARYLLVGPMRDQYLKHPELYPAEAAAYLQLEAEVPLATIVTPMAGVGPVIRIYQLP